MFPFLNKVLSCVSLDIYDCKTLKCYGTLKSDGHAKIRWSSPNSYDVTRQIPCMRSPYVRWCDTPKHDFFFKIESRLKKKKIWWLLFFFNSSTWFDCLHLFILDLKIIHHTLIKNILALHIHWIWIQHDFFILYSWSFSLKRPSLLSLLILTTRFFLHNQCLVVELE